MTNEEAINAINTWICSARRSLKSEFAREFFDAVESMEQKVIRYDWHDLRKNPEDLPEPYESVLLKTLRSGCVVAHISKFDWYVDYDDEFSYCDIGSPYAVKWKYIDDEE